MMLTLFAIIVSYSIIAAIWFAVAMPNDNLIPKGINKKKYILVMFLSGPIIWIGTILWLILAVINILIDRSKVEEWLKK